MGIPGSRLRTSAVRLATPRSGTCLSIRLSVAADCWRWHGGIPRVEDIAVDVHEWLTFPQLFHLYSVGQLALQAIEKCRRLYWINDQASCIWTSLPGRWRW
jgi:hypothetical protein